jgi:hypothetical protein
MLMWMGFHPSSGGEEWGVKRQQLEAVSHHGCFPSHKFSGFVAMYWRKKKKKKEVRLSYASVIPRQPLSSSSYKQKHGPGKHLSCGFSRERVVWRFAAKESGFFF